MTPLSCKRKQDANDGDNSQTVKCSKARSSSDNTADHDAEAEVKRSKASPKPPPPALPAPRSQTSCGSQSPLTLEEGATQIEGTIADLKRTNTVINIDVGAHTLPQVRSKPCPRSKQCAKSKSLAQQSENATLASNMSSTRVDQKQGGIYCAQRWAHGRRARAIVQ